MFARVVRKANAAFAREEDAATLTEEHIERLRERGSLLDVAKDSLGLNEEETAYIADIPETVREGMRASLIEAHNQSKRIAVQFRPGGKDYVVSMFEYDDSFVLMIEGPC